MRWFSRVLSLCLFVLLPAVCLADAVAGVEFVGSDSLQITERIAVVLLAWFLGLPVLLQGVVMVLAFLLLLIPHIAPLTPWTWDDGTIKYKATAVRCFLRLWNVAAGNWGKASNRSPDRL